MFIAGLLDGDGSVLYRHGHIFVEITFCRDCPKRVVHDVLKKVIAEKLGIISYIRSTKETYKLTFYDENAVRLLRHVVMYMHHPLRRLRAELILALYDGKIDYEKFKRLYKQTKYKRGEARHQEEPRLRSPNESSPTNPHPRGEKQLLE